MSRIRTGHAPDAWSENEPATAVRHARPFATIEAAPVGFMKPILAPFKSSDVRREQAREAGKRYRDRMKPGAGA